MSNVVKFPEVDEDDRGYLMTEENKINGIYAENVCAMIDSGNVYLGTKGVGQIDDALLTTKKNLNRKEIVLNSDRLTAIFVET